MHPKQKQLQEEHILVCLSTAPSNAKNIRTAAQMAKAFHGQFTALFVETPDYSAVSAENKNRLQNNCQLAEQLGATVIRIYGEDIAYQIATFAQLSNVSKIVLGRSAMTRKHFFGKPPLSEQLLSYAPDLEIYIIPDQSGKSFYRPKKALGKHIRKDMLHSIGFLSGATILSLLFRSLGFTEANIIMVYILAVLLTSVTTSHRIYSLTASIASVFIFNFLFTEPRFSLTSYGTGYPVTFLIMFLTAYISGTLALQYKEQAKESAKIANRTKILFHTEKLLSNAKSKDEILTLTAEQLTKLLNRLVIVINSEQQPIDSTYNYLPIKVNETLYGYVGIENTTIPLEAYEHEILVSILGECALALENEKNLREKEAAAILAESEQLRANLLRSISHDLRTPLTTISGNASNLLYHADTFDSETKQQIYSDIYEDAVWLYNLVENLLYATRIEEGHMALHTSTESLDEIVEEAIRHIQPKIKQHTLNVCCEQELLLVKADARLLVQVILNIIDNALHHTPPDSAITIRTLQKETMAEVQIADTGAGIAEHEKEKIFEKFYSNNQKIADHRRSIGLGLYLCKAIVEAHGGTIYITDNQPHGAIFHFTVPLEDVMIYA